MAFAEIAGVATPVASSLFTLAENLTGINYREQGRTAKAMGISGLDRDSLLQLVRE